MLFDEIAEDLAPGHSRLEYRWAATLKVRKAAGRHFANAVKKAKIPSFDCNFLGKPSSSDKYQA